MKAVWHRAQGAATRLNPGICTSREVDGEVIRVLSPLPRRSSVQCIGDGRFHFAAKAPEEKPAALSGLLSALANDSILYGLNATMVPETLGKSHRIVDSEGASAHPGVLFHP